MLFNSYIFIFLFLPICVAGFYLLKNRAPIAAKIWLIGFSLWFYGYFNLSYLAIMIGSILFNYLIYQWIIRLQADKGIHDNTDAEKNGSIIKPGKIPLIIGILGNVALLGYFKYTDFLIDSCNHIFRTDYPLKNILLPLGISFFTFQQIGFIADVYRGELKECDFVDYALFVSFFPQLIAGPIADGKSMLPQYRSLGKPDKVIEGITLFILGLSKKVLIADTLGMAVDYAYDAVIGGINSVEALLAVLFYALQLYFDFSGYCDMALGLGKLFGFEIPLNFDSPYKSGNIIEFWRRWHITLNKFLSRNVYIPLGGNRKGNIRTYVNLLIVFLISGIWHGAGVNFILWGCMHGVMYVITRLIIKNSKNEKSCTGILSHVITFAFVCIAWVFFRAPSVSVGCKMLTSIITGGIGRIGDEFLNGFNSGEFWYVLKAAHLTGFAFSRYIVMSLFGLFATLIVFLAPGAREISGKIKFNILNGILLGALFVWCVLSLSGVSTFLYFNF